MSPKRARRPIVVVMGLLVLISSVAACGDGLPALKGDQIYALGSPYMQYCESDANRSPDKSAQLEFLRTHPVLATKIELDDVWLDYRAEYKEGTEFGSGITVRYFAGQHRRYREGQGDSPTCLFGLVTPANRPEITAAMARYTRNGASFTPTDHQHCLSSIPPDIKEGLNGVTTVTLRCDVIE